MIFQLFALFSLFSLGSCATYDRINARNVTGFWMETGFASVDNLNWVSAATVATSFTDPIVLISLPDIAGSNSSQGYPSSIRLNNINFASGSVSFEMLVLLANDSFCSKTWYTPKNISPQLQISWMVVEKGAYLLDNHYYMALSGSLTRTVAVITSVTADPFVTLTFPAGCGGTTVRCTFPTSLATSDLGAISTLQTFNNNMLLMVRAGRLRRQDINVALTPHDALDSSYYTITTAETAGVFVYEQNVQLTCVEGISWETYRKTGVTSTFVTLTLNLKYRQIPGAFGMLLTQNSLVDSTGLRVFERSYSSIKCITQEDQCVDEETVHTTAEDAGLIVVGSSNVTSDLVCFIRYNANSDPTVIPSRSPTSSPSRTPTETPSRVPTSSPTVIPTITPSSTPSRTPTSTPTSSPTATPSSSPSSTPSRSPTATPVTPTQTPTSSPTGTCSVTFPVMMTKS